MQKRPFLRILCILICSAVWLLGYPFLHERSQWFQSHFRTYAPGPFPQDSALLARTGFPKDSLLGLDTLSVDDSMTVAMPLPVTLSTIPPLVGDYHGTEVLDSFFRALRKPQQQIRIAYYGDSSIEGDLICMSFRDSLQKRFGGYGVGFVPIMTHIPGFRRSVRHQFSDNWHRSVIGQPNEEKMFRGISGEFFLPIMEGNSTDTIHADALTGDPSEDDDTHWVSYRGTSRFVGTQFFSDARFFYGRPEMGDSINRPLRVIANSSYQQRSHVLNGNHIVNEVSLLDTLSRRIRINFTQPNRTPLYGVSLESASGIIVDNFPCRGNSGYANLGISNAVLRSFQEKLQYDLIILQYGLNVINPRVESYAWYERQLLRVVKHFQESMPEIPILLIGVPDKGTKINGQMQTDPSVPRVTNAQRRVAEKTGVAFFSFYEAMGGAGSMVRWVEENNPKLANTDYTHFNFTGAKKASDLLLDFLLSAFQEIPEAENQRADRTL